MYFLVHLYQLIAAGLNNNSKDTHSFYSIILDTLSVFYLNKKKQFYFLLITVFLSSLADVISFSLIIPVIYIINDPTPIEQIAALSFVYKSLHFASINNFIFFLLIGLVVIFLVKNLFLLFSIYLQHKFVYSIANEILSNQLTKFYKNDYLDIKKNNSVEYLRCLIEAPQGFADNMMMPMVFILNEFLVVLLVLIALLFYKPSVMILLILTIVPLGFLLITTAKRKLQENSDTRTKLEKESFLSAVEGINAYTDIKLFGKETNFIDSIQEVFKSLYKVISLRNIYTLIPRRIIEVLVVLTICLLFMIANFGLHVSKNEMVLILLTFSTAAYRIMPSLNEIIINVVKVRTTNYVLDLLRFIKDPVLVNATLKPLPFEEKIELQNINFKYIENNITVLENLCFSIKKGEFVVLTGDSGAGKTTIGKILTGFIKQDSGKYLIDKEELEHINQIKKYIGYVTQDFYLFDKTLLENIAIGELKENVDFEKIEQIIRYTNLKELVDSLPLGIHQPIGEMGAKLSGGQKQRIAIARALYKDIEFLVLDEATSSLDKELEQEVINTIYDISKKTNLTVLLITHRVSAIKRFDQIYEFNNGVLNNLA